MRKFSVFAVPGANGRPEFMVLDGNVSVSENGFAVSFSDRAKAQADADRRNARRQS